METSIQPKDLAAALRTKIELSQSYASQIVTRKRLPSLQLAVKIERELGIPPRYWVTGDEPVSHATTSDNTVTSGANYGHLTGELPRG